MKRRQSKIQNRNIMNVFGLFFVGEFLLVLFILFFVIGIPVMIAAILFFVMSGNKKRRATWQEVSQKIGLPMPNPKQLKMQGVYNGCDAKLAVGARRSGGEDSTTEYYTYCTSEFPQSLRFLLDISGPKGFLSGVFSSNKMTLGNANFDRIFDAKCYDQEVLRRLLLSDFHSSTTQNLMGDLMLASDIISIIEITDKKVYVETGGQETNFARLKQLLDTTTYLAARFKAARENFPLADWEKQTLSSWQNLAVENDLKVDRTHFTLEGIYKEFPIQVSLKTPGGKWQTEIRLKFTRSLMVGLKIMPENAIHKALSWFGLQDIQAGNKAFDDAFIVKAENVAVAKHLLREDFCRQLLGINSQAAQISLTDEEFSATFNSVLGDRKILQSYLEAMRSTTQMLLQ